MTFRVIYSYIRRALRHRIIKLNLLNASLSMSLTRMPANAFSSSLRNLRDSWKRLQIEDYKLCRVIYHSSQNIHNARRVKNSQTYAEVVSYDLQNEMKDL